jgi:serine acetyltransferase
VAVGAMSLVKEELLPFKIYAGIPVKCMKERSKKMLTLHENNGK